MADSLIRRCDSNLAAQWLAERCPLIDGIVFGDGRVKQVAATWRKQENGRLGIAVEPGEWTTIEDLHEKGLLDWTDIIALCEADDDATGIQVVGGEGGQGADGLVAALRKGTKDIIWIAFFTTSNPFEVVQIRGEFVLAKTNLGIWWRFPLDEPERVNLD